MIYVPHIVKPSKIHGIGVFTIGHVRSGVVIWQFREPVDRYVDLDELKSFPGHVQERIRQHHLRSYRDGAKFILLGDGAAYINNSTKPTSVLCEGLGDITHEGLMVAARDLAPGTEITEDYRQQYIPSQRGWYCDVKAH